jgi:hypothetical protein
VQIGQDGGRLGCCASGFGQHRPVSSGLDALKQDRVVLLVKGHQPDTATRPQALPGAQRLSLRPRDPPIGDELQDPSVTSVVGAGQDPAIEALHDRGVELEVPDTRPPRRDQRDGSEPFLSLLPPGIDDPSSHLRRQIGNSHVPTVVAEAGGSGLPPPRGTSRLPVRPAGSPHV